MRLQTVGRGQVCADRRWTGDESAPNLLKTLPLSPAPRDGKKELIDSVPNAQ
jgi:hypothetical protein